MTLGEFSGMIYTTPGEWRDPTIYVFRDEQSAYEWLSDDLDGTENHCGGLFCTLHSENKPITYMKEEIVNSKVWKVYAMDRDKFAVVIDY